MKERRKGYSWLLFALDVYTCAHITDETVRIRSLFPHTWCGILFLYFICFILLHMSLVSVAKPLGCNLCLSLTWTESYGSADFGSHGCPWECGLQLLHLRGAETVPKGQGGVEWYFRVCTDDGPATCDWMGVARMLRRSNKHYIHGKQSRRSDYSVTVSCLRCTQNYYSVCFTAGHNSKSHVFFFLREVFGSSFLCVSHCGCYPSVLKCTWFVWGGLLVC